MKTIDLKAAAEKVAMADPERAALVKQFAEKFAMLPMQGENDSSDEFKAMLKTSLQANAVHPQLRILGPRQDGPLVD